MNAPIKFQTITGDDGKPAFVVLPYKEFVRLAERGERLIPNDVVSAVVDGATPARAWREYLGLTQSEVARRMVVSQAAYAQMEGPRGKPRKATLRKIAGALGIALEQLDF